MFIHGSSKVSIILNMLVTGDGEKPFYAYVGQ
jgi:hypothetical protein